MNLIHKASDILSEHAHIALSHKVTHKGIVACMSDIDIDHELK